MHYQSIKKIVKDFLPPIIFRQLKKIRNAELVPANDTHTPWQGNYPDWQSACAACAGGYDSDVIFQKVREAARKVRDGKALWERDSVCFYHEEYNIPLVAWLMSVAAYHKGSLHVLDFGGALGSTYMQNKKLLDKLPDFSWSVVEQSHVVVCGQGEFSTDVLHFYGTMAECFAKHPVNVILFSGVLQYLPEPYTLLEEALSYQPYAVIVDRTPFFITNKKDKLGLQRPEKIYPGCAYPIWLFSMTNFLEKAGATNYHLLTSFDALDGKYAEVEFKGMYLLEGDISGKKI